MDLPVITTRILADMVVAAQKLLVDRICKPQERPASAESYTVTLMLQMSHSALGALKSAKSVMILGFA